MYFIARECCARVFLFQSRNALIARCESRARDVRADPLSFLCFIEYVLPLKRKRRWCFLCVGPGKVPSCGLLPDPSPWWVRLLISLFGAVASTLIGLVAAKRSYCSDVAF